MVKSFAKFIPENTGIYSDKTIQNLSKIMQCPANFILSYLLFISGIQLIALLHLYEP